MTEPAAAIQPTAPKKPNRRLLWLPLLVCIGAGVYYYLPPTPPPKPVPHGGAGMGERSRTPAVAVAVAKVGDIAQYITGLGSVTAQNTVVLHARVDGQLAKILFKEGQLVQAGDLLAELDPRPFQVQVDQAEGQLARDEALLQNARTDLNRYKGLYKEDSVAKQQLDTQAALVLQYQAGLKADQAQVENARLQLSFCHITAPISGRIGLRQVDAGNLIHSNDQNGLVVITELQPITVVFPVPEDGLPTLMKRLHANAPLPVEAWSRNGSTHLADGTLQSVDNQIDATTGTVKLKAIFANKDEVLFPNQFVNVRLLLDTLRGATTLPVAAIQRGSQGTFVYLLRDDQTVTVRPVRLGPTEGNTVALLEGIQPGDQAVIDGTDKLREGAKVEVKEAVTNQAKTPPPSAANTPERPHRKHHDKQ